MTSRLVALCVDAMDPAGLARYWSSVLAWKIESSPYPHSDGVGLVHPQNDDFRMVFVPQRIRKLTKNHIHLDLSSSSPADQHEAVARFLGLGGQHVDVGQRPEDSHVVLGDPEGNEFCVLEPGNSFVDQRSRFGSITCDGSPAVGHFWSAALGWPLVWDQDDETAIRAPDGKGFLVTWGAPIPDRDAQRRLHFDVAPVGTSNREEELGRLISLGATRVGDDEHARRTVLADPDGNVFCVVQPDSDPERRT